MNVKVEVQGSGQARAYHFENDIMPILSRFGCNSAGCHGNAAGQNGFKLSVFGFDPGADYTSLVKEGRGRRVVHAAPELSLLLAKASGQKPHGGGIRLRADSAEYEVLRGWITAGTPFGEPTAQVTSVRIEPKERILRMLGQQQLRVIARYSDEREVDVTAHARFQSNQEALGSVSAEGLVAVGETPGEIAIMASYMNCVATFRALVPQPQSIVPYPPFPENNFIDGLVLAKLKKLNIAPSELCSDSDYVRRVYLDVIGTLPTADEARRFLKDQRPNSCELLVDAAAATAGVRRLLGAEVGRSFARRSAGPWPQTRLRLLPLDSREHRAEQAVRPVRARALDGGRAARRDRPGELLQGDEEARRDGEPPSRRCCWGCASPARNAIIIPTTAGARPITLACRRSSRR